MGEPGGNEFFWMLVLLALVCVLGGIGIAWFGSSL